MSQKQKNKSMERHHHEQRPRVTSTYLHHERKCQTPMTQIHKKKQKSKQKSSAKKGNCHSIKQIKYHELGPLEHQNVFNKKQSPFKHKNRPVTNLLNARITKNIEHQLSHLNQFSNKNQSSFIEDSNKKFRYDSLLQKNIEQGKTLMKNNNFLKAITIFEQNLKKQNDNMEILYLLGVSYFHLQNYQKCIEILKNVIGKDEYYRKNVYLFLGISYKKNNCIQQAISILTKALTLYPKYYDVLILRAKILSKQKHYSQSIQDLNTCIKIQPQNTQAYIYKADCLRSMAQYQQSIAIYSQILAEKFDGDILLKRAIALIENGQIGETIEDLNNLISKSNNNSEALLFKGLAYSRIHNYNEAILSYQQAIKFNTSKKATTKALYEIAKLKISQGDFYGANHTLDRASLLQIDMKIIEKLKIFTDGCTSIMKKKFKKGIENFSVLCKRENLSDYIRPLVYSFRSYGYFCQHKFSNAINDLKNLQKLGYKLDRACQYNLHLLQGIICAQNNQYEESIQKFKEAGKNHELFADPDIYCCLSRICEYNQNGKNRKQTILQDAFNYISIALEKEKNQNPNTLYLAACILFELGDLDSALDSVEKAMEKLEDHLMRYLYLIALIMALKGKYKEAYKAFSNVLGLLNDMKQRDKDQQNQDEFPKDKQIPEAYLNRAKCYLLFDEKKKAFQDLQTYIAKKPLDSQVHAVAGKLLFSIGSFEDAIKAYNYSPNIEKNKQILLERVKCYLLLKDFNSCLKDMQKMAELGCKQIRYDYHCLDSLKEASKGTQENYTEALIKIGKVEILNIENGLIFKQSDMYFYKGVFKYYLKEYSEACKLFTKSKNLKSLNNELQILNVDQDGNVDQQQLENKIYTDKQIEYNIAVTQLMMGKDTEQVLKKYCTFSDYFQGKVPQVGADCSPFPTQNRFCSIFPQTIYQNRLKFHLSFCLPEIVPPEIKFQKDAKIIQDINMCSIEPKPDAPWIKRNNFGVIFTDEIIGCDIDIKTQKSINNNIDIIKIDNEGEGQQNNTNSQRQKMKKLLSLDHSLKERLQKLIKDKDKIGNNN